MAEESNFRVKIRFWQNLAPFCHYGGLQGLDHVEERVMKGWRKDGDQAALSEREPHSHKKVCGCPETVFPYSMRVESQSKRTPAWAFVSIFLSFVIYFSVNGWDKRKTESVLSTNKAVWKRSLDRSATDICGLWMLSPWSRRLQSSTETVGLIQRQTKVCKVGFQEISMKNLISLHLLSGPDCLCHMCTEEPLRGLIWYIFSCLLVFENLILNAI